jgi:acylphosphatase
MLVRLLYASRAVDAIGSGLIDAILAESHAYNAGHGITGILCAYQNGNVFIQAIEGSREEVNRLYNNIVRDARHTDVTVLDYEEIGQRAFSSWRMGRVDLNRVNVSTILRYSEHSQLDPFRLPGKTALALLLELATTTSVVGRGEPTK